MKKFVSIFLLLCVSSLTVNAVEFDTSIDDSIRQNYNVEKNSELPALPNSIPTAVETVSIPETPIYNPTGKIYSVKSGTKVKLVSTKSISDWTPKGSVITFKSTTGFVTKEGTIVPAGTIFKGKVTDSHQPQITGNGGLIELTIDEIYFNGVKSFIETTVSSANYKKVFFGDIKGKRSYWKNFARNMNPGKKVFLATKDFAKDISNIPIVNLLSVVSIAGGSVFYVGNVLVAPVVSVFQKGKNIAIPAGSEFQIKITDGSEIRG